MNQVLAHVGLFAVKQADEFIALDPGVGPMPEHPLNPWKIKTISLRWLGLPLPDFFNGFGALNTRQHPTTSPSHVLPYQ